MLFNLHQSREGIEVGQKFMKKSAIEIGVKEKNVENWIADNPQMIFPNEKVLIIGQSIAGESMADVLALDTSGNLIIVEIKRSWSNRKTVGQLLEYASKFRDVSYERLSEEVKRYEKWDRGELYNNFLNFVDDKDFSKKDLGKKQRIMIVAPDADTGLKNIINWLKEYGVPIEFIPFHIYADNNNNPKLFMVEGTKSNPETPEISKKNDEEWAGHWIFNTNESNDSGAYKKMFDRNVAAIWGYDDGPKRLEGTNSGDIVMAYVNKQGLRAMGKVIDPKVKKGEDIFLDEEGNQRPEEYHLSVDWEIILKEDNALTASQAKNIGYNLPYRVSFGKMRQGESAKKIEEEIRKRAANQKK